MKSFVVSLLIRKFEVCAVRAICIGTLSKENIWLQRRKMEKLLEDNEHIVCLFLCITAMVEKKKAKAGKRRNYSGSSEEDVEESSNNNCGVSFWIVINWPQYGLSSFVENISSEFLTAEFDLISCEAMRSRGRLTIIYLFIANFCSMFYSNMFAVHSRNFYFSKIFRKLEQIAIRCYCPVYFCPLFIVLKDHKSTEAITLIQKSYENVVCQAALEQGFEIENVAVTEVTDFSCKSAKLVIRKFIDSDSKKELLLSGPQHLCKTDLHLKLIDLDPTRGIIILFILPLTGKLRRSKNIFFQVSINKSEANQLFPVLRFFVLYE